jgi:glutathione synthase/RimK-type ligase-like ATP-grasp enzyme
VQRIILVTTADDLAADLIVLHLRRRNANFVRFNQEDFPTGAKLVWRGATPASGNIALGEEVIDCADIASAWFRYPVEPLMTMPEHQLYLAFVVSESTGFLSGFLETMPWFWMNRPSAIAIAANKLRQLVRARELGLIVPETLATNCAQAARDFISGRDGIAKTVTNAGFSQAGQRYVVYTTPVTLDDLSIASVGASPVIYQQRIVNDFDLRVTVVGNQVFAVRILVRDREGGVDWRALDASRIVYERYRLPDEIENRCIALTRALSLSFAALDFIVTPNGEHVFLEINPSGQWGWLEQATGLPITDAMVDRLVAGAL